MQSIGRSIVHPDRLEGMCVWEKERERQRKRKRRLHTFGCTGLPPSHHPSYWTEMMKWKALFLVQKPKHSFIFLRLHPAETFACLSPQPAHSSRQNTERKRETDTQAERTGSGLPFLSQTSLLPAYKKFPSLSSLLTWYALASSVRLSVPSPSPCLSSLCFPFPLSPMVSRLSGASEEKIQETRQGGKAEWTINTHLNTHTHFALFLPRPPLRLPAVPFGK
mmetsp:Transcript_40859/g.80511  ORF Transcript_40859/g.80511 Transcript_40859/m.80511 type:complete len:221 (+) Transcript_40859:1324-1986(+)